MNLFRDLSIRAKLQLLMGATAALALLLASFGTLTHDSLLYRRQMIDHLRSVGDVVSGNARAALTFDDPEAAAEILASLQYEGTVLAACIVDHQGQRFASYRRHDSSDIGPPPSGCDDHWYAEDGSLHLVRQIRDADGPLGVLHIQASMEQLKGMLRGHVWATALVLLVALSIALAISSKLQRSIAVPITELAETAEHVSSVQDYSIRVKPPGDDEIGALYSAFNGMLAQIELGQQQLQQSYDHLEQRVDQRTRQLSQANRELLREVAERKRAEQELLALQQAHLQTARQTGMAEIAANVLHNVGNVLNSVNVSLNLVDERIRTSGVRQLSRCAKLVAEQPGDLGQFVAEHPQGRYLPSFLLELSHKMEQDEEALQQELQNLSRNVEHIKRIIAVQQSNARMTGFFDEVRLVDVIQDAMRITAPTADDRRIDFRHEYEAVPPIVVDKQKLLQILVNLISNAKYALIEHDTSQRRIILRVLRLGEQAVAVEVEDTGIGIPPENLTRIFSHGFTTRSSGHGFGLHGSALYAKEMGGELCVRSEGPGRGACFTLKLPLRPSPAEAAPVPVLPVLDTGHTPVPETS